MMEMGYRHLLLAVEFSPEEAPLIERAVALRDRFGARLSLIHVVDPVPPGTDYAGGAFVAEPLMPEPLSGEAAIVDAARERLNELGGRLGVAPAGCFVELGAAADGIARTARDQSVDLVLVGTHDRHHWLDRLLGSTSKAVLAHPACDLLVVRISPTEQNGSS